MVPVVFPDVEREMDMIGELKLPENRIYNVLLIESILGVILLLLAHFSRDLLNTFTFISFIICIIIHIRLYNNPSYSVINLTYIATSGVLPFFFSQIGYNFNFIFYSITGLIVLRQLDIKSKHVVIVLLMLLFIYVNSVFSSLTSFTTSSNNSSIFTILFPVAIFIFNTSVLKNIEDIKKMYIAIFIGVIISSFDFILIYINGSLYDVVSEEIELNTFIKISGVSNQVNQLAEYIVFIVPLAFVILSEFNKKTKQIGYIGIVLLSVILLFMSSRGGIALIVIYFVYKTILGKGITLTRKVGLLLALIIAIMLTISYNLPIVQKINLKGDTGDEIRLAKVDEALEVFGDYPIFGIGLNNYTTYTALKYGNTFNTHNTLLSVISEQGIVGFILFLSVFAIPYINFYNSKNYYSEELKSINTAVIESCTIIFLAFFMDHLHGSVVYYILIATAIKSTTLIQTEAETT